MSESFTKTIDDMEQCGEIYRAVKHVYGDYVAVSYMDPRNHLSIIAYLIKQKRKRTISFRTLSKSLFKGIRIGAVFYNGQWINETAGLNKDHILTTIEAYWEKERN